ncbi:alpha/beta hydrolase [Vibrio hannami]|uniref:alpha/beta fold hydrolase n=1 Tax=Vibrio hannami TaxID=2717094 RepID=UPI00240F3D3A|nr:alpha/beta hydrolase [Vibrio hannami]MDG3087492.1 alpha/beta hydrolase [Vibrio hannami]
MFKEKPVFKENRYQLEFIRLAALESGVKETADLTVVFLHGWLDNSASFISVMENLREKLPSAHLVSVDLPGHGQSSHRRADNFYPFHDYIDDLNQLVTNLSPNRLVIVGHSLGALIASCYSAAFPEKVDGLVQIEGYGPLSEDPQNAVKRIRKGVISRDRVKLKPDRGFSCIEDIVALRADLNRLTDSEIRPIIERGSEQREGRWYWKHDPKLKCDSLYRMSPEHAQAVLSAIECPHSVILGSSGFERLAQFAESNMGQNVSIHTITGTHHCHLQQPELTSELIVDLVNKI